ncbi:MAG: hypothetical protein M3P96_02945, partial [Actinomycetota bacterium]|nr:hypothetical protein [Actinomycetota bacterium]
MAADGFRDPGSIDWVTRTLPDDLLAEVEMGRPSALGDGGLSPVNAYWLDWTIVSAHGLGFVLGGVDPPVAVTEAAAQFAGRETPPQPVLDREAIRWGVNEIHKRTAKVTLQSARRAVA